MTFLLCNDDGIYADGIKALEAIAREFAPVTVVAPATNHSGASSALTLHDAIVVERLDPEHIMVHGTPTDCVHLALTGLIDHTPSMVISGINHGSNLGDDVFYSGTVAAAIEGRFLGLSAVAFSMPCRDNAYLDTAKRVARHVLIHLQQNLLPANIVVNVNVPACQPDELKGIKITRLGARHCAEPAIKDTDSSGHEIYWIGPAGKGADAGPGTDFDAVKRGYATMTPLVVDMTNHGLMESLSAWARNGCDELGC